jgi:SAM-dependent methyltransferase
MGVKLQRKKQPNYLGSFLYKVNRILPLSKKAKFKLYLNLEWVFERFAHEYSFKNYSPPDHPIRLHTKKILLDFIKPEQAVLDLGCHKGDMSVYLADKAKLVVGVDYDQSAINLAKEAYKKDNLTFICADAYEYLNSTDIKFDILILSHILEHLDDPGSFLRKYTPFFKYLYIELPDFEKSFLNQYRKDMGLPLIYTDDDHVSEFGRGELTELIEKCGLQIISAEYVYGLQKIWCKTEK